MSYLKEPKTFDEQLEILKDRGLIIENEEEAKFLLSNINYYRFTAYLINFKTEKERYAEGVTFELITNIYKFDKELRGLIINVLESIEISFRTYISYTLAMRCGASGYLDETNFINRHFHKIFIENLEREKNNNSNKLFIKHHNEKYNGQLPIWVASEIMTFGMVSKLYSNLLPVDKSYIKSNLCRVNPKLVNTWLQSLTNLRNHCAYYGRVYGYLFPVTTIKKEYIGYDLESRKIFASIIAMKHLISDQDTWNKFFINIQQLIREYEKYIELRMIGFPENWIEILSKKI